METRASVTINSVSQDWLVFKEMKIATSNYRAKEQRPLAITNFQEF